MTKPEIKVGQIWRIRDGRFMRIVEKASDSPWPFMGETWTPHGRPSSSVRPSYTVDGWFYGKNGEHPADLMQLVGPQPFEKGQTWRRRDGQLMVIVDKKPGDAAYPIVARHLNNDGSLEAMEYDCTITGHRWFPEENPCDLIEKVENSRSCCFEVGQTWRRRDGRLVTITSTTLEDKYYPIVAYCTETNDKYTYTATGEYYKCRLSHDFDLIEKVAARPSPLSNPEVKAIFNGEKPIYVVIAEADWTGDDNGPNPEPIVFETSICSGNSFASFQQALERQKALSRYGTTVIAECHVIRATRIDK